MNDSVHSISIDLDAQDNQWADEIELKRKTQDGVSSSDSDAAVNANRLSTSSFSYQTVHTPRGTPSHGGRAILSTSERGPVSFDPENSLMLHSSATIHDDKSVTSSSLFDVVEGDRESHRERFMSDAERVVAADPIKTRESFMEIEATTTQGEWHERSVDSILRHFGVNRKDGLTTTDAQQRLTKHGLNSLEADKKTPVYIVFILQFTNLIMGLLLGAALASIALQEYVEGIAIIAIVTLNGVIATIQEQNASNALDALQKMTSPQCVVIRDSRQQMLLSDQLVPGDIVVLTTGDIVPADIRLLESADFKVNEMILTGESEDVLKRYDADMSRSQKLTADNMVFSSTSVATGNARGVVVETGMSTRVGAIATLLKDDSKKQQSKNPLTRFIRKYQPKMTPLQEALHRLGVVMGSVVIGVCIVVFVVGMVRNIKDPKNPDRPIWLNMVMVAVSLAVSAVPEGLPMVVTICLSTGTAEMVKKNVLVRKLAAVESLGAGSVICTDKTGTLTEGKMTAVKMWGDGVQYDITGQGFNPTGDILRAGVSQTKSNIQVRATLLSAALCSNTNLQKEQDENGNPVWVPMGNSSEAPLIVAAAKAGIWRERVAEEFPRLTEVPFSSMRKMMITVNELAPGKTFESLPFLPNIRYVANVKGAPNYILKNCTQFLHADGTITTIKPNDRHGILEAVDALSSQALRVLAVAIRPMSVLPFPDSEDDVDKKFDALCEPLIFLGLIASIDPPREGVKDAIHKAREASIRTVMITGDYLKTAVAIAKNIDLLPLGADTEEEAVDCTVLRSHQGTYLAEPDLDEITSRVSVFARAKPEDKIEIVKSLQRQGHVAAMTGDGVNDAPALKEADIGVAMGIAGTAVAKGASDMILTDDNFCSIVAAVEKGREIYGNIQRFVCFLLSTNFGEISVIFLAIAIGMPNPLEPLQILVLNLFADGMAAVALSLEKGDGTVMKERPRPRTQPIIHGRLWVLVLSNAALIAIGALIVFTFGMYWNFQMLLQDDITAGTNIADDEGGYANVVCTRWLGMNDGWRDYTNCGAKFANGTYRFDESIRSLDFYENDDFTCYGGDYECLSEGISRAQTMAFIYITMMEMMRAYTARSFTKSVFKDIFSNKWMQLAAIGSITLTLSVTNIPVIMDDLFGFAYVEWFQWLFAIAFSLLMVAFGETLKFVYRRRDRSKLRWQMMEDGFSQMLVEMRNLRHHIERLEGKFPEAADGEAAPYVEMSQVRSSTSSSSLSHSHKSSFSPMSEK